MASSTPTPLATTAAITSPFLKLAPELRNRIYDFTFKAAGASKPVPHALTRINRQIRSECRAMYYSSIACLEIPVRTLSQIIHTQKWLAEEDWSMFPVLPKLVFLTYHPNTTSDIEIVCPRSEVVPAPEFLLALEEYAGAYFLRDEDKREMAFVDTYVKCLGVRPDDMISFGMVPEDFIRAVATGDMKKWAVRE